MYTQERFSEDEEPEMKIVDKVEIEERDPTDNKVSGRMKYWEKVVKKNTDL